MTNPAPPVDDAREILNAFADFINEPPQYEDQRVVRDYRHELARKWIPLQTELLKLLSRIPSEEATETWYRAPDVPKEWEGTYVWCWRPDYCCGADQFYLTPDFSRVERHCRDFWFAKIVKPEPPITRAPGAKT